MTAGTARAGAAIPRRGPLGRWDRLVGPGASAAESTGAVALALAGAATAPRWAAVPRSPLGDVLLRVLATDLWGGAWVNHTPAAARWYERPGQDARRHLAFAAAHVHPFVLAVHDRAAAPRRLRWAVAHYGYLVAATAALRWARPRARRRLGVATTVAGVLLDRRLGPSPAAPWFAAVFYVKLLAGHAAAVGETASRASGTRAHRRPRSAEAPDRARDVAGTSTRNR